MVNVMVQQPEATILRGEAMDEFLRGANVAHYERLPLGGDASFRRYIRLVDTGAEPRSLMLMDAPPEKEDVRPFVAVGEWLAQSGFSAPQIIAKNEAQGWLLLEDLGDDLYARVLERDVSHELALYEAACDLLQDLHGRDSAALTIAAYDESVFLRELALFTDWWMPAISGDWQATDSQEFLDLWPELLREACAVVPTSVVLRDFHAENILWMPERGAVRSVGLLDFQDALMGPVTYDLVSLLEDARRDVSEAVVAHCKAHCATKWNIGAEAFALSYAVMAAQRNIKILGIFMRLSQRDGKAHYEQLIPRVWAHVMRDVKHPALHEVAQWLRKHVPVHWWVDKEAI